MVKRIFIIRHAKSDHGAAYHRDIDRPLSSRGRSDARKMATILKQEIDFLDHLLVSSAKRTTQTARYFIDEFDLNPAQVTYTEQLYLPDVPDIWRALSSLSHDTDRVAVFTHNPAAGLLLNLYRPFTDLPTCSILEFQYDGASWFELDPENLRFISHKYPRQYD